MMRIKGLNRKLRLTRWGIIALVVVVALGTIGVTYAGIKGEVKVKPGELNDPFTWVVSNDDGSANSVDPGDNGLDPNQPQTMGVALPPEGRYTENVASTFVDTTTYPTCSVSVTINNAYPCYYPTIFYGIKNDATVPTKIASIVVDENFKDEEDTVANDIPELTVTVSGIYVPQEIAPGLEVIGDLAIHVEQCALQGHTYTIRVKIITTVLFEEEEGGSVGFWKKSGEKNYGADLLNVWLTEIDTESLWLVPNKDEDDNIDVDDMDAIFVARDWENEYDKFIAQYTATSLNVKAGRLGLETSANVTAYDPGNYLGLTYPTSAPLSEIIYAIEKKHYEHPDFVGDLPTEQQFTIMKDVCEFLNNP